LIEGNLTRLSKRPRADSHDDDGRDSDSDRESVFDPGSENSQSPPAPLPTLIPDDEGHEGKHEIATPPVFVNRRERALLLATFRREQRVARQAYLRQLRVNFDADISDGRDDRPVFPFPTEAECIAEAWENYLFDYVIQYDEDQSSPHARVVPGFPNGRPSTPR
jgi:hypothetical protein